MRHGETEWSRNGRHTGVTDIPLTPMGERQARALRPLLAGVCPATVFTSPRTRAIRTAELAGLAALCSVEVLDDLAEWAYGEYEGVTTPDIRKKDPAWTVWTERGTSARSCASATVLKPRPNVKRSTIRSAAAAMP